MTEETGPKKARKLISGETLKNYAGAIAILLGALPAVGSLVVSVMTAYRGEPVAEKTWDTVRSQLNKQAETINKLHLRLVHFQGHEEGRSAAAIQQKLDDLRKRYDELKAKSEIKAEVKDDLHPTAAAPPASPPTCNSGQIRIGSRCQHVPRAVAEQVKADEKKTKDIKQKLIKEKIRRLTEEQKRRAAEQKVEAVHKAPPLLRALPKKLDDVDNAIRKGAL